MEKCALRSPDSAAPTGWQVNSWVKQGILLGFRLGKLEATGRSRSFFRRQGTFPARHFSLRRWSSHRRRRLAQSATAPTSRPGSSACRRCYINTGAYVDEGTLVDSHALVGSCAQIGKRVHLSAAAQIGGVLEPVNASPVIIEDDVLVGGNCGVYEGTSSAREAVLAPGTILTRATPLYDLVNVTIIRASADTPLIVPREAVVVPGSRAVNRGKARNGAFPSTRPSSSNIATKRPVSRPRSKICCVSRKFSKLC